MFEKGEPRPMPPNFRPPVHFNQDSFKIGVYLFQFLLIGYFYLISYWLVPRFLNKRRAWLFLVLAIGVALFNLILTYGVRSSILFHPDAPVFLRIEITLSIITLLSGIAFGLIKRSFANDKKMKEIEAENLRTELLFLRSQISPHFLLNTLNNLVSLARKKSENLEPMLLQLSGILKYMVYEAEDEKIKLTDEIAYLKNYIALQQLRFNEHTSITFNSSVENEDQLIVPMLLIPFVENAFKHGVVSIKNSYIDIVIREEKGILRFSVINKYDFSRSQTQDKASGIGLSNVRRRLELLYPDRFDLNIEELKERFYSVNLKVDLG